jgi:hypothetical protein
MTPIAPMLDPKPGADAARAFLDYFCCPPECAPFQVVSNLPVGEGFFRFGPALCFGKTAAASCNAPTEILFDAFSTVEMSAGEVRLCFDPTQVVENLRRERYQVSGRSEHVLHTLYYLIRPIFPSLLRRSLQRAIFRSRCSGFPAWPVDCSVEQILESLMALAIQATGTREIPFIWFWPDGNDAALMMTHDVEEKRGIEHCQMLMDLDESFGINAAFQLIPQGRYQETEEMVACIRARGFETNIHDLDHDGRLYEHAELFQRRARKINEYARKYGIRGFRAGSMHRNQDWFDMLDFQYEMSVPTVSHLEPQKGGCCTVTPYFVGSMLELPLTTLQDHGLFYILAERSIDLWKQQIEIISAHHGLISFIVHPDYIVHPRERALYRELLEYISRVRKERDIWLALPGDINDWWRQRSQMRLVREGDKWQIRGKGSERAQLAYAGIVDGRVTYRIADKRFKCSSEGISAREKLS